MIVSARDRLLRIVRLGNLPHDDEATRLQKTILMTTSLAVAVFAVFWGLLYLIAGEPYAAAIPLSYSLLTSLSMVALSRALRYELFRFTQILLILLLPLGLMLTLGGYVSGSAVVVWAFLAPLGALLCWNLRQAALWFVLFLAALIFAGLLTPLLPGENNLPDGLVTTFFVFNIGTVSALAFGAFRHFVHQKELALRLTEENRDLAQTNLRQELLLRQSEKLATLGRLSAGIAHELNNPAAAATRGAEQLRGAVSQLAQAQFALGVMQLTPSERTALDALRFRLSDVRDKPEPSPLELSDREAAVEDALTDAGLDDAWSEATTLVAMGAGADEVAELAAIFGRDRLANAIAALTGEHAAHALLDEIASGTARVSTIVAALKSYTAMDQAPVQSVDLHEGLDSTLTMLRARLSDGIELRRDYADDLPAIEANGGDLNQVWTHLIDNALDAMGGVGELTLRTRHDDHGVTVEVIDSGHGVANEDLPHLFEPFFTTRPVGEGTGLGLTTSQGIVRKHGGDIAVRSHPGETRFTVKLPLRPPPQQGRNASNAG
jgi:signal transduction histidine kinase